MSSLVRERTTGLLVDNMWTGKRRENRYGVLTHCGNTNHSKANSKAAARASAAPTQLLPMIKNPNLGGGK